MEDKKKKKGEGVLFQDYSQLSQRVDRMENSMGQINTKVYNQILLFFYN